MIRAPTSHFITGLLAFGYQWSLLEASVSGVMSGAAQQKADPATGMYAPPASSAVTMVSASKLISSTNVGFLTSDGKPRQLGELEYNIRSGGFGEVVDAVAGKSTDMVEYVRWAASDPAGPDDEIYGLGTLGEIASDTLSLDADSRLSASCTNRASLK